MNVRMEVLFEQPTAQDEGDLRSVALPNHFGQCYTNSILVLRNYRQL